jgi:hypothetical protein
MSGKYKPSEAVLNRATLAVRDASYPDGVQPPAPRRTRQFVEAFGVRRVCSVQVVGIRTSGEPSSILRRKADRGELAEKCERADANLPAAGVFLSSEGEAPTHMCYGAENGETMAKLVVHGAMLACSMGSSQSTFSVLPTNQIHGRSNPAASVQDVKPQVNIAPFGMCQSPLNPQVASATAAAGGASPRNPACP